MSQEEADSRRSAEVLWSAPWFSTAF
jgi:hypothetical protein